MLDKVFLATHTRGMDTQNQIKRTLSQPVAIDYVTGLLKINDSLHRSELVDLLCERFGFHDVRGQRQRDGCVKALRELEAAGHFTLPAARGSGGLPGGDRPAHRRWPWG